MNFLSVRSRLDELSSSGIALPGYARTGQPPDADSLPLRPPTLDAEEQERLRAACAVARDVLVTAKDIVRPGVTTDAVTLKESSQQGSK